MKRVLLAYDGSPGADDALADLSNAALGQNVTVKVLTLADVWMPAPHDPAESSEPEQIKAGQVAAREHAMELLATARQTAARGVERVQAQFPTWTVEQAARADSPSWAIMAEARDWRADLIVLGSHGRSSLEKFFLGSVSYKVAAEAQCSVRIARPKSGPDIELRVIVAIDGSSDSKAAVTEVLGRPWPQNAHFQIIMVADSKMKTSASSEFPEAQNSAQLLDSVVERFRSANLKAEGRQLEGEAKSAILKEEVHWNANCIFLGARGLHHRNRLYPGTTASAIASRAHCTVEIFREGALLAQN